MSFTTGKKFNGVFLAVTLAIAIAGATIGSLIIARPAIDKFANFGDNYKYYLESSTGDLSFININTGVVLSHSTPNEVSIVSSNGCSLSLTIDDGRFKKISITNRTNEGILVSAIDHDGDLKWDADSK